MKVLGGSLKETQFHWPDNGDSDKKKPLSEKGFKTYPTNSVTYINGNELNVQIFNSPQLFHNWVCYTYSMYK